MNLKLYQQQKIANIKQKPIYRELCTTCLQPKFSCYCKFIHKFDSKINFIILIHPIEVRRRIATGRMSHLSLQNSHLIAGQDFSKNEKVNQILADQNQQSVLLYPGATSKNLSLLSAKEIINLFPQEKKLAIFVIDGTWATAKKTIKQSQNLKQLPRICFTPDKPSNFRVRKQPAPACYSTLEAIHQTIELMGPSQNFNLETRKHDALLFVFNTMVELQLHFIKKSNENPKTTSYRRQIQRRC